MSKMKMSFQFILQGKNYSGNYVKTITTISIKYNIFFIDSESIKKLGSSYSFEMMNSGLYVGSPTVNFLVVDAILRGIANCS